MKVHKLRRFRRGESDYDSDKERQKEAELFSAIGKGELEKVKDLLESGLKTDIINRNNKDNTPLHYAVERGKKEIVDELLVQHWNTDIDAKNRNGDTALHIASSRGNEKLVELLLKKGASTGIRNLKGNTALELAKNEEIKAILSAKISRGTKRPVDEEDKTNNDKRQKLETSGEYPASGLKTSLHGTVYQLKLLMLFMKRGLDLGYEFRLATEMDAADKMDDLVFQYEEGGEQILRFLQAKHKQNEDKKISVNDFLTETDGEFSLQKYFKTFRSIQNNPMFNRIDQRIRDLIICTNIDYDHDGKKGDLELKHVFDKVRDERGNEKIDDIMKTVLIKFKDDFNGKGQIVSVLENSSDLIKLAKILADCVLDGKKIDNDKLKNDAGENLLVSYQLPLIDEVIDIASKKLKDDFIEGTNLSEEGKNLRNAFEKVFDDRRKSYNIDDNPYIRNGDLGDLAQEIATLMAKDKGSKPVKILRNKNVIKNNIDELAGYVIVMKDGKKRFSSRFMENNELPGNLDLFRNRLRIELLKKNIPFDSLNNYNFEVSNLKTCEEVYVDKNGVWNEIKDRKLKLFDEFGKTNFDLTPVDKFVDKLARLINESKSRRDDYVFIERKDQIISKNIDKLGKHVLIEENGKIRFSDEFLRGSNLPGNLDQFRTELMLKVNDPDHLGECKFEIGNFPKLNLPNDSIENIHNDIESYFNHLVLALKQPSEIALDKIIREEMGEDKEINLIDSDFLADQFQKEMLNWMKEKTGRFLDHTDGLKFFGDMKSKLASLVLTCPSLEYRSKFEELNIQFKDVETELKDFLHPSNKNQIFNFISPPDTVLGSIEVYQTLKSMPQYKPDDSYIFIRSNSLLRIQDKVANAFKPQSKRLLIIECKPSEGTVQESYEELFRVITPEKKIVLITEGNDMLSQLFKNKFGSKYVEKNIEVNSLLDLTHESQNKILNERKVIFQGEEMVLGELINDESRKFIDAEALSSLINEKRLEIAKPLQGFDDVKDYYMPRTFGRGVKIYDSFQEDTSNFYVTYDSQFTARDLNNNQDIILITDRSRDFIELCDLYKRHNKHWLKKVNNEFIWQKSEGSLSKIRRLVDRSRDNVTPYEPEKVGDIADRIVIVAAEPGMGKSTVLTNLAVKTKTYEPTSWVANINLRVDCSTELESLVNKKIRFNDEKIVEFLLKITKLDRELDRELFKDFYERGNMVLLFDGFDEISPDYKSKVIELLRFLKNTKIEKIWVTTRPYNIGDDLEDALSSFSYSLKEFSDVEQRIFLQKLWNQNLKLDDNQLDEIRANIFIDELLNKFTKSINDREREFTSIPLQLKMIADVFTDDFHEFYNSNSDELSDEHKRKFEKDLDMISLYKRFFDVKFDDILFGEKSSGLIKADPHIKYILGKERKKVEVNLKELALHSLYGKFDAERLLSRESDPELFENVKDGRDKTGIIVRVIDGQPIFVHQTFAEYFSAVWFAENWKKETVKQFLSERLYTEKNKVTRNFFDRLLARDEDNVYEMHDAALNNDEKKIENLLQNDGWGELDKAGRTPLHLAASYGFENIVERLLKAASQKQIKILLSGKDKLFNWSPLSYADRDGHWNVAESLLENGANGDDMFEAINSIKNGGNLLHVAAEEGYLEFAKFLLENGATMDASATHFYDTPLHLAAESGRLNLVKYFVNDKEARLDARDILGNIPLHLAAKNGHLDVVKFFVDDKGVKLDVRGDEGNVPLHYAAEQGKLNVIKYFVEEKGMDVSIEDQYGQVPLHMAAVNGQLETVEYLVRMDANLNTVNKIASNGGAPLHMAAEDGNLEVVKYLMKNGAEFGIMHDSTPLHWAALDGNLEVVRYFVENDIANIEAPDYDGSTPLHLAASYGHLELAEYLVNERRANLEALDNEGSTALHLAARNGKSEVVNYFLERIEQNPGELGQVLFDTGEYGMTPLHYAALNAHAEVVDALLSRMRNSEENLNNLILDEDEIADEFHYHDNKSVVKLLLKRGAELFLKNKHHTILHEAIRGNDEMVIKLILEKMKNRERNINEPDSKGDTPLMWAVERGQIDATKILLDHDAGFDIRNNDGRTALHWAVENDYHDITKLLIEKGANPGIKDYEGRSPLSLTRNQAIVSLLESHHEMEVGGTSGHEETGLSSGGECPPSEGLFTSNARRRKRQAIGECELEWEDVDAFNEEKEMIRNHEEIKIDSGKFLNYIKSQSMSESKLNQLIKLANEVQVTGEYQSLVEQLTNNEYTTNHLTRVGVFAGNTMHAMMAKNIVSDFLNENYKGVAINIALIGGGKLFAKLGETASIKGLKLISEEKFLFGNALKVSSPFLARATTAFVVYDLINQLKSLKSGNKDAVVSVVGDSIYLGVDVVEISVEVAEAFELLEGVSAVTGPIGAVIGAVVFVGTDIYTSVKKVEKIEKLIDLSSKERFVEGVRAFIGMQPEEYIADLMNEKELNNQLVKEAFDYLKQHGDIISYVFPTGKSVPYSCRKECSPKVTVSASWYPLESLSELILKEGEAIVGYIRPDVMDAVRCSKKCKTKFKVDLDSRVLLDRKISNIKWGRAKPDRPISGGDLLCSPEGDYQSVPYDGAYLCRNAIGVTASNENKSGNYVLINLEEGEDYARGFIDSPNIFLVKNGIKNYQGGDMNDTFLLIGDDIKGSLFGGGGVDTLDLSNFAPAATTVNIIFETEIIIHSRSDILRSSGMNRVLGRGEKSDWIFAACDEYSDNIEFLDGQGGNETFTDHINIEGENCTYDMTIVLKPYTVVHNGALKGNFVYIVPRGFGRSIINFHRSVESLKIKNNFIFEYELTEIGNISVKNLVDPYKNNSHLIKFYFSPNSDREYNVTISAANNPIYRFGNDAEMKVGNTGKLYILQNSFDSVADIIERCFGISNRLKNITFFIQSLSSDESVVIGSGDHEVIQNNPLQKSHLIGNGGENTYVIDSVNRVFEIDKLPLPEVVIYDLDDETSVDVIDLRNLVGQARASRRYSIENDFAESRIYQYGEDLIIKANVIDNVGNKNLATATREYFSIRLKQGINWNNKTRIITDNVLLKINLNEEIWSLKPVPLIFEKENEIIIINDRDVGANSELITPRKLGDYIFIRNNATGNLVITNAFSTDVTKNNLCTIIIMQFYQIPKLESLSIKFSDKKLILKDHREEIYAAKDIDTVDKQYNHRIFDDVLGQVKSVNRSVKTAPFHRSDIRKRKSKHGRHKREANSCCGENVSNSATRSGNSWINDLFNWMTEKKNTFLTTSSVNINLLTGWFFGSKNAAMRLGETEYRSPINEGDLKSGYFLRSIDFNGGILLTDVILAKMGNRRLHAFSKRDEGFSELETLGHALRIRQEFEDAVEKAALKCGIPASRLDFDFLQIQTEISKRLMSARLTGIDLFLTSHVEKSLAGLSEKEIERFMRIVDHSSLSELIYGSKANNKNPKTKIPDTVENENERLPIRFEPRDSVSTINYSNTFPSKYFPTEVSNALNN